MLFCAALGQQRAADTNKRKLIHDGQPAGAPHETIALITSIAFHILLLSAATLQDFYGRLSSSLQVLYEYLTNVASR